MEDNNQRITRLRLEAILKPGLFSKLQEFYLRPIPPREVLLTRLTKIVHDSNYRPRRPEYTITIDKGHGVTRRIYVYRPEDYLVYIYAMLNLDSHLAHFHQQDVFGGYTMGGPNRRYPCHPVSLNCMDPPSSHPGTLAKFAYMHEYKNYSAVIKDFLENNSSCYLLTLDIANFYDSINLQKLEKMVYHSVPPDHLPELKLLFRFLNRRKPLGQGVPQEMIGDCSRLLAHFYLCPFDVKIRRFCRLNRIQYTRYLDDQVYCIPKNISPDRVIFEVSKELSYLGLNLNLSKVELFGDLQEYYRWRGYDLYGLLPPNRHGIFTYSPEITNRFVQTFLSRDPDTLYKHGSSIMKSIVSMGINKLEPDAKAEILHRLQYQYFKFLDERHFLKLIEDFGGTPELHHLFVHLDHYLSRMPHNSLKYEILRATSKGSYFPLFSKYLKDI